MRFACPRTTLSLLLGLAAIGLVPPPLAAQDLPFPIEDFWANDSTARWLIAYDNCAWRSTDKLLERPPAERTGLSPIWMCLNEASGWHALYGRYDETTDRYQVRFHFRVTRDSVTPATTPLDTARVGSAARALAAAVRDLPELFRKSGARFNTYVQFRSDSALSVWVLPAWQPNGVALFGAEARFDYQPGGRVRIGTHSILGPLRGTRPDSTVAFRIDSNGEGAPTVGDLFFYYQMRPYFSEVRIQTPRYSSSVLRTGEDEAWVHVVRDPKPE